MGFFFVSPIFRVMPVLALRAGMEAQARHYKRIGPGTTLWPTGRIGLVLCFFGPCLGRPSGPDPFSHVYACSALYHNIMCPYLVSFLKYYTKPSVNEALS